MKTESLNKVKMTPVAGLETDIPNYPNEKFTSFGKPVAGLSTVAFYGSNTSKSHYGIYLQTFFNTGDVNGTLELVCNQSSPLPTIGNPTSIHELPHISDGQVYFLASNAATQGVYAYDMSTKEIGEIYVCAASEKLSKISASQGRVTFNKANAVNAEENGIWLIKKDNAASVIIKAGTQSPVQILGTPMNANYHLYNTGAPFIEGDHLVFVGELQSSVDNSIGQALIRYSVTNGGLLSILKDGDTLPTGEELVGKNAFASPLAFRDSVISCKVEYNSSDRSSTYYMAIGINADNSIINVAENDVTGPQGDLYTNEFASAPMTANGKVAFVSDVELKTAVPSTNLFINNSMNVLGTYIEGAIFPYNGKQYLQQIDQVGESFFGNMIAARCFWNDGLTGNEDLLGIYVFFLAEAM